MKSHTLYPASRVAIGLCCYLVANLTFASTIKITGVTAASSIKGIDVDNDSLVSTVPISYIAGAPDAMKTALKNQFPTWKFTYSAGLMGTLNINTYKPISLVDDNGGAILDATYTMAKGDPTIANLHWIQLVITNKPNGGGPTTGYIDPLPNDDKLPFYWTVPEDSASKSVKGNCGNFTQGNKTATTYHFYDCSNRTTPSDQGPTFWTGDLLLASWTNPGGNWLTTTPPAANQNVTIYDGIQWGWSLYDPIPEPNFAIPVFMALIGLVCWRVLSRRRIPPGQTQPPRVAT
jgi:hypothetical protein